jgi:1-acyl-sn-glycerol-3-phosphate acyltransferase
MSKTIHPKTILRKTVLPKTILQRTVAALVGFFGWKVVPRPLILDRCVVLGVPHTSNWDFILLLIGSMVYGKSLSWLGKKELFEFGMGPMMRALGGFPVRRDAPQGLVQDIAETFAKTPVMRLVIPPEGTRGRTDYWKSGFYRIAMAAKVPVHLGKVDYVKKIIDFGEPLYLTGDMRADMDKIRAWYAVDGTARFPEQFGPIRLKDEDDVSASS